MIKRKPTLLTETELQQHYMIKIQIFILSQQSKLFIKELYVKIQVGKKLSDFFIKKNFVSVIQIEKKITMQGLVT